MAKENRMSREDYLKEIDKVEDTAYAEQGHPQTFGNELLLQNIDAFGVVIHFQMSVGFPLVHRQYLLLPHIS